MCITSHKKLQHGGLQQVLTVVSGSAYLFTLQADCNIQYRASVSMSVSHVFLSLQLSVCLLIYLQPAGICFSLVTHYVQQPKLHLKPAKSVDFLLSEACEFFIPPDRLTHVVNVHPDSQLSGLKVDDHRCNQRV